MSVILGIETSCDETSASVCINGKICSNVVSAQHTIHESYGGVVPELASRDHQRKIVPVIEQALHNAKIRKNEVEAVAFTRGPGLLGSLMVGVSFAKSFALAKNIPLIEVNHMQAHVLSHFISVYDKSSADKDEPHPEFPFLCLTVSGGHTHLVLVKSFYEMKILGRTQDDAAGEAFDKAAKILGLPYPGGPFIDKYARDGNPKSHSFPIADMPGYDFSFSGLKTSFLYFIRDNVKKNTNFIEENRADMCASVQHAIVLSLMNKLKQAADDFKISNVALSGGVSANSELRKTFEQKGKEKHWKTFVPKFEYCTDNAAMIALAGYYKFLKKDFCSQEITPLARYPF